MTIVKKTFLELKAEKDAALHNSNMQNLATAHDAIEAELVALEQHRVSLEDIKAKIEIAANNPDSLTTDLTHELFNATKKLKTELLFHNSKW